MAFETKEQILEKILSEPKPICPHCKEEMNLWEVPMMTFSDGLGWGVPYLYLCFNDECSLYKKGWDNLEENYGQLASYRCLSYPGTGKFDCMPVFSPMGATGQVIDEESIAVEEMLKANVKRGFSVLADCYVGKDGLTVLKILLDPAEPSKVRLKAAEMIGDVGALEAVDTLRNHKFSTKLIQEKVDSSISKIHGRFFTRECPFCAEIIKKQAKICKHCGKDVAGQ